MKASKLFGVLAIALGTFAFGFVWRDVRDGKAPSMEAIRSLASFGSDKPAKTATQVFRTSFTHIRDGFVGAVDPKELRFAAMEGLMSSLGDPHTSFLPPQAAAEFKLETRANFVGVGARLSPDPLGARVVVVFEDGPAKAAGIRPGDLIIGVDGKTAGGTAIDEIVSHIRGKEGTYVLLKIVHASDPKPVTIKVRRSRIITPTVEGRVLPGTSLGYVAVATFSEPTASQFDAAVDKLDAKGIRGLVIDLRDNPGGLLDTAVDMLSRFVENKVVVKMKLKDGREEIVKTYSGSKRKWGYPVVCLVNEDSASAAEIFAGAMRDYRLTTLVGEHTYGKSAVQNVFPLIDEASAKITIARYYLPGGEDVGRKVDEDGQFLTGGLKPDVLVPLDLEKQPVIGDPKTDSQLAKAVEILKQRIGAAAVQGPASVEGPGSVERVA